MSLIFSLPGCDITNHRPTNPPVVVPPVVDPPIEPVYPYGCEPNLEIGWQSNSTKHWHRCKDAACKLHLDEAAHDFGEEIITREPTCITYGLKKQICKICNYEKVKSIPANGHVYEQENGVDKVTWIVEPDCITYGSGTMTCTVCNEVLDVTADKLGHAYEQENGVDKVVWIESPDCTHGGIGKKVCTRCRKVADVITNPLGHEFRMIDPMLIPTGNRSAALLKCDRCGIANLGLSVFDVTSASAARLDFDDDGGARFKGRPIGNAIPLPQDFEYDHTPVWDKNETGDFFEFEFDLTETQIDALNGGTCRIYAEAKSADWMYENQLDFWANPFGKKTRWDPDTEWTPGMYIDDAHPGKHVDGDNPNTDEDESETGYTQGQFILDYRYVLYVDGQVVEFDDRIKNPVEEGANKEIREYVIPYIFNLHAGKNKISLHMAGGCGYLSTFYNFLFRTVNDDIGPIVEVPISPVTYGKGDVKVGKFYSLEGNIMMAADCDGQNAPVSTNKDTRLGKNNIFTNSWDITGIPSGSYDVYVKGAYSAGNGNSYWSADQNIELNHDSEANNGGGKTGARYNFKVDDLEAVDAASEMTYAQCGLTEAGNGDWTKLPVANIGIPQGAKTFTMNNKDNGYSIWVFGIVLVRTGKYIKPGIDVTFNEGKVKIECENFADISEEMEPVTADNLTYISIPAQKWPQVATEYNLKFAANVHVKLVLRAKYISAPWGYNGVAELFVDGVRIKAPYTNLIGQDLIPENEWIDAESVAFDLTAGTHVIKLQGPGGCELMWDYFELVEVA